MGQPLYVLRRISDKFVINPRAISNGLSGPVPGDDQEYLPILTDAQPDFDSNFTALTREEGPNEVAHTWEITYVVQDRPKEEILAIADNVARFKVQTIVPPSDFTESMVLTLAAILRQTRGLVLTQEEQAYADSLVAQAEKLTNNRNNLADIKTAINAGNKPDLAAGWEVAEAVAVPLFP